MKDNLPCMLLGKQTIKNKIINGLTGFFSVFSDSYIYEDELCLNYLINCISLNKSPGNQIFRAPLQIMWSSERLLYTSQQAPRKSSVFF